MTVTDDVKPLTNACMAVLDGAPREISGAVLADLLAMWLAGHVIIGDAEATSKLRARLLMQHVGAVLALTEVNAHIIGASLATTPPQGRA